ncbi:MAG TPA: hypothetical protein PLK12_09730 [Prolixibacteraceae bacterium]|nr:hypothetical protein [Prolixibacteraceae bacterium]
MKNRLPFFDRLLSGLILGLIVPFATFLLYYRAKFGDVGLKNYLGSLHQYGMLFKVMSLCVLVNLPAFYLLLHFKLYRGARGMVMACFFYAFAVLGYRILQ